jgi:hypothetical protein
LCYSDGRDNNGKIDGRPGIGAPPKRETRGGVDTKEGYQDRVESELEQADSQIEIWRVKTDKEDIGPETKADREERLAALSRIQTMARLELEELKRADKDNWDDLKARMDGLLSELRNALTSSSDRFL